MLIYTGWFDSNTIIIRSKQFNLSLSEEEAKKRKIFKLLHKNSLCHFPRIIHMFWKHWIQFHILHGTYVKRTISSWFSFSSLDYWCARLWPSPYAHTHTNHFHRFRFATAKRGKEHYETYLVFEEYYIVF